MAEGGSGSPRGLLSLIFATSSPQDVALRFLSSQQYDEEIGKKEATSELEAMLSSEFELAVQTGEDVQELRARLARHILTTDLLASLQGKRPEQLASLKVASQPAAKKACIALARTWRQRRDTQDSYIAASKQVFADLSLSTVSFPMDQISYVETFLEIEQALQSLV